MQQETSGDPRLDITLCIDSIVIAYVTAICLLHNALKAAFISELVETIIIASVLENITT